ncbi:origin recognition complex subunit 4 C-terminus-domain-containing protein [Podospora aff. communis PSN243]|uniref:Origin recognition complex subunit 4 n=1 Tax=Podospora aff. communis PSN243 TaxID=3040156 RepID=A0AAV9GND0_9PEZI|nr:origin recognition complex subunit 4 C-terminus-domain-containing protein [Podospora aff. communis PSN243]
MSGRKTAAQGRKRPRVQNEDDSPSVSSASAKRPRLNGTDSPLGATSPKPPGLISTAISGALSLGRRIVSGSRPTPEKPKRKPNGDPWEIPDSEDERSTKGSAQPKKTQSAAKKKPQKPAAKGGDDVYDVPDSGDELASGITPRKLPRQRKSAATASESKTKAAATETQSARGKRGRPVKEVEEETQDEQPAANTPTKPRSARRQPAPTIKEPVEQESEDDGKGKSLPPRARRRKNSEGEWVDPEPKPKGILTPMEKNGDQRRKSVAFKSVSGGKKGKGSFEEALSKASESASKPARGRKLAATKEVEVEDEGKEESSAEEEEEEDDEVCVVCSKPDSKKGNEIVFCDNCDSAYHQKCCGLTVIPKGDWICGTCSQEEVASAPAPGKTASVVTREAQKPDIPNFEQHLQAAQRVLLERCAGRRRIKLLGQDDAYDKASQLVEQTVVAGEGNSMMVIGARGCGKTTLVESIVSDLSELHKDQFHVVRLNGFIHTDDKLALREIWRQLGKEMEVEDDLINKTNNYADTMASLLALLSHPSEIAEAHEGVTSKSVIFLIDEFDLFATHARQTLLYNLFDIAQARKAPIAVLGLTTRIDVVESLEKRVKSRFSHRYVYLSLPKSMPAYWDVCRQGLSIDDDDMVKEGIDVSLKGHGEFWKWWNGNLEALRKASSFQDHLESHFYSTKSVPAFLSSCILPLSTLTPTSPSLQIPGPGVLSLSPPDSKLHVLEALSDLDLSMLIAAARLDIVAHTDTINFAMAYDEYTSLMSRQRVQSATSGMVALGGGARVWGRGIASMAWERLVTLGMLIPAATVGRGAAGQSGLDAKMWKVDVALEEIPAAVKLNAVLSRWCKEI